MQLQKCVALITGGAQGLGRAMCERLLKDGAKVVVADVKSSVGESFQREMEQQYGSNRMQYMYCDVSKSADLSKMFKDVRERFGSLDIVCNNAAIIALDTKQLRKIVDVNLTAVMEGTFNAIELMKKDGKGGVIINVASAAGLVPMAGETMYTATKTGVVAFTRSFKAMSFYKDNQIRINCLCPFFCDTEMTRETKKYYPKEQYDKYMSMGTIEKEDVVKAFMACVTDKSMNGDVVAIYPGPNIFKVKFGQITEKAKL